MNPVNGHYSIVQYCPDLARRETVNIGVVLLVPDRDFLQTRMVADNERVRHFFGLVDEIRRTAKPQVLAGERGDLRLMHIAFHRDLHLLDVSLDPAMLVGQLRQFFIHGFELESQLAPGADGTTERACY